MTPAEIAEQQFRRGRAWLARSGKPEAEQDARLRPWAAVALRAGAELAELPPDVLVAVEDYRRANCENRTARALVADDLCPLAAALEVLATARDDALDQVPHPAAPEFPRKSEQAHRLQVLAAFLGARPYRLQRLQDAA